MFDFGQPISGDAFVLEHNIGIGLIPLALAVLALIIHIVFAVAVFKDATARRQASRTLWFVPPIIWAGATLVGSVFVAAVYWAMHYSTLAKPEPQPKDRSAEA